MTFEEAKKCGFRVQRPGWYEQEYIKFLGDTHFTNQFGGIFFIDRNNWSKDGWILHPEDQKIVDFNNKLEELLKEERSDI